MPAFFSSEIIIDGALNSYMPFYSLVNTAIEGHAFLSRALSFILVLLEAFMLVRINAKFVLIQQRTFLPALFFILIAGHNPILMQWNPVLPATFFIILLVGIIFGSYRDDPDSYRFFEAGILLGLGSLFYAPLAYLLVFIWISCMVQRPFYWREYLFPVLGLAVPYAITFAFLFLGDKNIPRFLSEIQSEFAFSFDLPAFHLIYSAFTFYFGFLILIASVYLLSVFQFRKIYIRDYFMVLFWLFLTGLVVFVFLSGFNTGLFYVMAISVSYMLTNYFITARKSIGNKILFYILLGYSAFIAIYNFTNFQ